MGLRLWAFSALASELAIDDFGGPFLEVKMLFFGANMQGYMTGRSEVV